MHSRQAQLQEDKYFRVMCLLERQPDVTQRDLANSLNISVAGLNYCLKSLVQKGFVKAQNFKRSNNKAGYLYLLTPDGLVEKTALTARFLERKMREYEALRVEIGSLRELSDKRLQTIHGSDIGA